MTHKLDATVFVYRHRKTQKIAARYLDDARALDGDKAWEHVATLEPRMWIEYHYDERFAALVAAAEREACAKVCEEIERKATKQPPMVGQGCQACAAAIRARGKK